MVVEWGIQQIAVPTSGSTMDITWTGLTTPTNGTALLCLEASNSDTADGSRTDDYTYGRGKADGTRQYVVCIQSEDAVGNSDCDNRAANDACMMLLTVAGAVEMELSFRTWLSTGVQLNIVTSPITAHLLTATLIVGLANVYVDDDLLNAASKAYTAPGFTPDVIEFDSADNRFDDTRRNHAKLFCGWSSNSSPIVNTSFNYFSKNNQAVTNITSEISTDRALDVNGGGGGSPPAEPELYVTSYDVNGYTATRGVSGVLYFGYAAIEFPAGTDFWVGTIDYTNSSGLQLQDNPGITLGLCRAVAHRLVTVDVLQTSAESGTFSGSVFDQFGSKYATGFHERNTISTSNTASYTHEKAVFSRKHGGPVSLEATFDRLDPEGFYLDKSSIDTNTKKLPALVIGTTDTIIFAPRSELELASPATDVAVAVPVDRQTLELVAYLPTIVVEAGDIVLTVDRQTLELVNPTVVPVIGAPVTRKTLELVDVGTLVAVAAPVVRQQVELEARTTSVAVAATSPRSTLELVSPATSIAFAVEVARQTLELVSPATVLAIAAEVARQTLELSNPTLVPVIAVPVARQSLEFTTPATGVAIAAVSPRGVLEFVNPATNVAVVVPIARQTLELVAYLPTIVVEGADTIIGVARQTLELVNPASVLVIAAPVARQVLELTGIGPVPVIAAPVARQVLEANNPATVLAIAAATGRQTLELSNGTIVPVIAPQAARQILELQGRAPTIVIDGGGVTTISVGRQTLTLQTYAPIVISGQGCYEWLNNVCRAFFKDRIEDPQSLPTVYGNAPSTQTEALAAKLIVEHTFEEIIEHGAMNLHRKYGELVVTLYSPLLTATASALQLGDLIDQQFSNETSLLRFGKVTFRHTGLEGTRFLSEVRVPWLYDDPFTPQFGSGGLVLPDFEAIHNAARSRAKTEIEDVLGVTIFYDNAPEDETYDQPYWVVSVRTGDSFRRAQGTTGVGATFETPGELVWLGRDSIGESDLTLLQTIDVIVPAFRAITVSGITWTVPRVENLTSDDSQWSYRVRCRFWADTVG